MFDAKYLANQKAKLNRESKRIKRELKTNSKFPELGTSVDDNAQEAEEFSEQIALENRLKKELSNVDGALKRIEKNEYGVCLRCKKMIDKRRLNVYPAAKTHLDCKKDK